MTNTADFLETAKSGKKSARQDAKVRKNSFAR
jgi:hypothetical protein